MKAIELIRVSTEAQAGDDRASIPSQRAVNLATAARFGLEIVETIELTDVSGASVLLAPEIQRLIVLIQSPDIGAVITREFSRLMRPEKFSDYALLQAFADSRTKLYLPEGPIDFSEKGGRLMGTIRAAIAGLERSEIQERCWRGKEEKRKQGKSASGAHCLPFGVSYDRKRGWFYNEESPRVRKAFDMILSGVANYAVIARRTDLSQGELTKLLRNPIWTGWRVYDHRYDPSTRKARSDGRQGYSLKVPRAPEDVIRVKVIDDPLVSDGEFQAALRVMEAKREGHRREYHRRQFVYGGFLCCGICGSPMSGATKPQGNIRYYICRNRKVPGKWGPKCEQPYLRADELEQVIDEALTREMTSIEFSHCVAEQLKANHADAGLEAKIERLETEIRAAQQRRDRIAEAFIDGAISKATRDERIEAVDSRLALAQRDLVKARQAQPASLTVESVVSAFEPFAQWDVLGKEDRRRLLALTIPRIRVNGLQVTGFYRLLDRRDVSLLSESGGGPMVQKP